jgi:hypothetical protein
MLVEIAERSFPPVSWAGLSAAARSGCAMVGISA